jgi:hypothetical protein
LEEKGPIWSEKRMSPRVYASGKLIFKVYRVSSYSGYEFHENPCVPADLLDMSMDGIRIKTFSFLEEKNLLEFNRDYQLTRVAMVRWVKKMEDCYHAGLLYIHH